MKMKKRTRYLIFLFCLGFGIYFLVPSLQWYRFFDKEMRDDAALTGENLKLAVNKKVNDILNELYDDKKQDSKEYELINKKFIQEMKTVNKSIKKLNESYKEYNEKNPDDKIELKKTFDIKKSYKISEMKNILYKIKDKEKEVDSFFRSVLVKYYEDYYKDKKNVKNNIIKLGLDLQGGAYAVVKVKFNDPRVKERYPDGINNDQKNAMLESAIIKIENRINKYGLSETTIQKQREQEKIIIYLPGVKEATELRQIIETVGVLEFKLVSRTGSDALYRMKNAADLEGRKIFRDDKKLLPEYQTKLEAEAPNTEVLFLTNKDRFGVESEEKQMVVVEKDPLLGGSAEIKDARVQSDQYGQNVVTFELGQKDADKWAKVTEEAAKTKEQIAIVLDDVILTHPTVQEKISGGRSQIRLGNAPITELQTLALILRSGSLDVPLEISEEHTVGASLGRDTITKGLWAIFYGLVFVLLFMFIWYNVGGIIADIAMLLNLLLLVAGLALFKAVLTLPGIVGIILTVGMAVDANVIIFERIKEEFRSGKTFKTAVQLGFNKAFWTIMDANLTTFAAGIGLSLFGTGPIKGFAVTLCLGIVVSLFTALFVSRLIFDSFLSIIEFKSLRMLSFRGK